MHVCDAYSNNDNMWSSSKWSAKAHGIIVELKTILKIQPHIYKEFFLQLPSVLSEVVHFDTLPLFSYVI